MDHAHAWHLLASYPWERGSRQQARVPRLRPDAQGAVRVAAATALVLGAPPVGPGTTTPCLGRLSGFLLGVGFATFVFAVAVMRGCASLPPAQ